MFLSQKNIKKNLLLKKEVQKENNISTSFFIGN